MKGKEFFWLGKLELNLSGEERLELSIGCLERGVLLASVFGDCNVLVLNNQLHHQRRKVHLVHSL